MAIEQKIDCLKNLQEVTWQIESGTLHITLDVQILANDLRQRGLAQLSQLSLGELDRWVVIFIPVTNNKFKSLYHSRNPR